MDDSERVNVLKLLKGWWCFRYAQQHEQTCQSNQNTWNYAVSPVRWQSNAPHFAWNENKTKRTHTHTHMKIDWLGIRSGVCSFVCFGLIEEFNYLSSRTQQSLGIAICSNHKDYICFRLWITSCARRSRIYAMATESRKKNPLNFAVPSGKISLFEIQRCACFEGSKQTIFDMFTWVCPFFLFFEWYSVDCNFDGIYGGCSKHRSVKAKIAVKRVKIVLMCDCVRRWQDLWIYQSFHVCFVQHVIWLFCVVSN